ncbi:S41 family peptidase [Robertkochia aurantiaca]|uniref:S41 family peptidase n=1 Tax=Robertkochia aurantiaca TaxID=2873700 RepID=UPI001CCFC3F3|nr:S41 family peptidase [Robertkochia sp. 3YJGBD-33]
MKYVFGFVFGCLMQWNTVGQTLVSREAALGDIDFFNKTLLAVHYDPYFYVSREEYDRHVNLIKEGITDSVHPKDFIKALYKLTSVLEDGHTAPSISQKVLGAELSKSQFFPWPAIIHDEKLFLSESTAEKAGIPGACEVVAINGHQSGPLLQNVLTNMGGLPEFGESFTNSVLAYFLYLEGISAPFAIEYVTTDGKHGVVTTAEGIDFVESIRLTLPGLLEGNAYKVLQDDTGYINFATMSGEWEDWSALLQQAFDEFRKNNISRVVIDLRQNLGGNSILGEVLFGFITDKPFQLQGSRDWRISQQYKDQLLESGNTDSEYHSQNNGSLWHMGNCESAVSRMQVDEKFTGEVFLATGPLTFSSANMVADAAKTADIGTLIGEPTGENTNDFGEVYSFALPASGIIMQVTTAMDYGAGCDPEIFSPVVPDIIVKPALEDKLAERDVVLEYIFKKPVKVN